MDCVNLEPDVARRGFVVNVNFFLYKVCKLTVNSTHDRKCVFLLQTSDYCFSHHRNTKYIEHNYSSPLLDYPGNLSLAKLVKIVKKLIHITLYHFLYSFFLCSALASRISRLLSDQLFLVWCLVIQGTHEQLQ